MDKANRAERLTDALKLLEETAKEKKEELTTLVSDKYSNLKETLSGSTHNVAEKLGDVKVKAADAATRAREAGSEKAKEVAKTLDENVHRNPWPYVGGTAVVALLLGYILGRK